MKERMFNVIKINILLLLIFITYYLVNKYTGIYIPCIFNKITGLKCPGCGITRLLFNLVKFNFEKAFFYNPLVFIYLPFIVAYYFYICYIYVKDKKDNVLVKIPNFVWNILIIITISYGIIRNIIKI